jgi:hypothetical protein
MIEAAQFTTPIQRELYDHYREIHLKFFPPPSAPAVRQPPRRRPRYPILRTGQGRRVGILRRPHQALLHQRKAAVMDDLPRKFPLTQQIEEVERELRLRTEVYARWIASGKMRRSVADYHMERMRAVLDTLKRIEMKLPV